MLRALPDADVADAHADVASALEAAFAAANPGDRVIAFGSFFVAAAALAFAKAQRFATREVPTRATGRV